MEKIDSKMAQTPLSKQQEIELLDRLEHGEGYFAETFSQQNIEKMKSNITNDFPLLLGTGFQTFTDADYLLLLKCVSAFIGFHSVEDENEGKKYIELKAKLSRLIKI